MHTRREHRGRFRKRLSRFFNRHLRPWQTVILFALLAAVVALAALHKGYSATEGPAPVGGQGSAYGWHPDSPHFRDSNGQPYLKTWTLAWSFGDDEMEIAYPDMNCKASQANMDACRALARQRSTATFDSVIGRSELMNKTVNPSGKSYAALGHITEFGVPTDSQSLPGTIYQYVLDNMAGLGLVFSDVATGCTGDFNTDKGQVCSIKYTDDRAAHLIANYWSQDSVINSYQANGYQGIYSDSDTDLGGNQIWQNFLDYIKQGFQGKNFSLVLNSGGYFNFLTPHINAGILEHEIDTGWTSKSNDLVMREANKVETIKTTYPDNTFFYQAADYGYCWNYLGWAPYGSAALAQRTQMALADYYLIQDPDVKMAYRHSGTLRCGGDETWNFNLAQPQSWLYDIRGHLPLGAAAYNVGQPLDKNPVSGISVLGTVSYKGIDISINADHTCTNLGETNFTGNIYQRFYQNAWMVFRPEQPYGPRFYQQGCVNGTDIWNSVLPYVNQDNKTISNMIPAPFSVGVLGYNGSLLFPITQARFIPDEGFIGVKSPFKVDTFVPAQFPDGTSVSKWQADSVIGGTKIAFDALTPDEAVTENITNRPAEVILTKSIGQDLVDKVEYLNKLSLNPSPSSSYDLDSNTSFTVGGVAINSSVLPDFDASARVTMQGLNLATPKILRDGQDCTDCVIESYSGGTLVFRVSGFSSYTAVETPVDSGNNPNTNDADNTPTPQPNVEVTKTPPAYRTPRAGGGTNTSNILPPSTSGGSNQSGSSKVGGEDNGSSLPFSSVLSSKGAEFYLIVATLAAFILALIIGVLGFRRKLRRTMMERKASNQATDGPSSQKS